MLVRISEVFAVLAVVFALTIAKHLPVLADFQLAKVSGIICFGFAIYLALRLYAAELARLRAED